MAGKYKPRHGDRAFGPCNRKECPFSKGITWAPARSGEVYHDCPIPGKVDEVEWRKLRPGKLYEETHA